MLGRRGKADPGRHPVRAAPEAAENRFRVCQEQGKDNPADIMTKAVDKATIDRLLPYLSGDKEIPLPDGLKIWFGPYDKAELRANRA